MRALATRVLSVVLLGVASSAPPVRAESAETLLRFGTEMAQKGNWREAQYRWERAASLEPADGRILNNLAVVREVAGDGEAARTLYEQALAASPDDRRIRENAVRAARLWTRIDKTKGAAWDLPPGADGPGKKKRDAVEVPVSVALPPRIELAGIGSVLVASFLVEDDELLDANREMVRFVRAEFRKRSALRVLDVTPAPAVPEQTVDDMAANASFWRRLGREHGADLIVSGLLDYTRRDASGFKDVDVVSEYSGQKVRQTRFVEQEEFTFAVELLFFRGSDGALLYRDKVRRQAIFPGLANDPITAFYRLAEAVASDVRSAVAPRTIQDSRYVFRYRE